MDTSGLTSEAFKLMIKDVASAREVSDGVHQIELKFSNNALSSIGQGINKKTLTVKLVWVQGDIVDIRSDPEHSGDLLVISDGTGEAVIHGWDVIPGGDHQDIEKGCYIAILGQIVATSPSVYLRAVKISVLNRNPLLKTMWPDEVQDLQGFLLGRYASWNSF